MFLTFFGKPRGDKHTHEHAHESPAVMLVPLGVLAIGAVFSGMVWYGSFFGDHNKVNAFFGIPAHTAEAAEGHGDATAEGHGDEVVAHGEEGHDHETMHNDPNHAVIKAAHHGQAPKGAIFMAADNHVMDDAHHAPTWVKLSPFIAMLLGFLTAMWFYVWDLSLIHI